MALATIAGAQLTAALKPQLTLLVDDMRARLNADTHELKNWRTTHREAVREQRTATSWTDWSEDQLTQAAVGWLLTSVFVRFCEDNLLLGDTAVWIAGPTPLLRQRAVDAENSFYREHQDCSYREWLEQSFDALRRNPATQALVDEHAALNIISPSSDAVQQLLGFWRQTDDAGELVWSFHDDTLTTRFLGDLYQHLSDNTREKFDLLQTPTFVEEFILDQTLDPALKDRPLEDFKIIDPACGSGHFLLGAFDRLVEHWHRHAPAIETRTRVDNALASIYGVDLNPFSVAIAKFRLIVAAMRSCNESSLVHAPKFTLNLVAGDSLLHGPEQDGKEALDYGDMAFDKDVVTSGFTYSTEDAQALRHMLAPAQYDAVVGNPPYSTVSDKARSSRYREIFTTYGKGASLVVPFTERFFALAKEGDRPGWVGFIAANTFTTRTFGRKLIERFLPTRDISMIIDMSGVYMEGFGLPTLVLIGRNRGNTGAPVRTISGIRGEPSRPAELHRGKVWTSITDHYHQVDYSDNWIEVSDKPRDYYSKHPWIFASETAVELLKHIRATAHGNLTDYSLRVGFFGMTHADSIMQIPHHTHRRRKLDPSYFPPVVTGRNLRDYQAHSSHSIWFPYDENRELIPVERLPEAEVFFWPYRTILGNRATFDGSTYFAAQRPWHEWHQVSQDLDAAWLTVAFCEMDERNNFVLDRAGSTFKQSAPVIKFKKETTEDNILGIWGILNSSLSCYWLKQNSHNYGDRKDDYGARLTGVPEFDTYDFTSTTVSRFPLTSRTPVTQARHIENLKFELDQYEPGTIVEEHGSNEGALHDGRLCYAHIRAKMIAAQEELDWQIYRLYGVVDDDLTLPPGEAPPLQVGERAFEIALARECANSSLETSWFVRNGCVPITEVPASFPPEYHDLIKRRLEAIRTNPFISALERPEYKRRWAGDSWDTKLRLAIKEWLLDKLEDPTLWFSQHYIPTPRSVAEIAAQVEKSTEFIDALDLWAGQKDAPVTATLVKLIADEAVPYLAALRYKESGLRKREEWEHVWKLQRDADAGEIDMIEVPVPPSYTKNDFVTQAYWSHRGPQDVPKERFISYPNLGRATDSTQLIGWAGWNYAQQGLALASIYTTRESEGTPLTALVPLVAGIAEVLPWVKQWHSGVDPNLGVDLAEYLSNQLAEKSAAVGVPVQDLPAWRPEKKTRGRKATTRKAGQ